MKIPALHLNNEREVTAFVNWAFGNIQYATMHSNSTAAQVLERLMYHSEEDGISVYVQGNTFWSTRRSTASNHPALTLVNSLNHLKAYLARKKGQLCVSGISHPAYMFRAGLEEGTTLVNSLDHLIAYLRAHGKLKT